MEILSLEHIAYTFFLTMVGTALHIVKKSINNGISPIAYLKLYKGRTATSLSMILSSYATILFTQPDAGPEAYFAIGYVLDSMLNRAPTKEEVEHGEGVKVKVDKEDTVSQNSDDGDSGNQT